MRLAHNRSNLINDDVFLNDDDEKFIRLLKVLGEWLEVKTQKVLIFVEKLEKKDVYVHGSTMQCRADSDSLEYNQNIVG